MRGDGVSDDLRIVLDNMLDLVFRLDAKFRCTFVSPSVLPVLGYEVQELVGTDLRDAIHPDDLSSLHNAMRAMMQPDSKPGHIEVRVRHRHSRDYVCGETAYRPLRQNGKFAGVVFAWRDITKRKEAQARYRQVIEAAREVIFQTDVDGRWRLLSPRWVELTGLGVDETLGKHFSEVVHPEDREEVRAAAKAMLDGQRPSVTATVRLRTRAGATRWCQLSSALTYDQHNRVTGGAGTLEDVTAQYVSGALAQAGRVMDASVLEKASLDELTRRVCESVASSLCLPLACVGLQNVDGTVQLVGHGGRLTDTRVWDETCRGGGPNARAIQTRQTQIARVAELAAASDVANLTREGLTHVLAIPLLGAEDALGTLCVCTDDPGDLGQEVVGALESLAGRINVALRLRQQQSLMALQAAAMATSANGLFITDADGRIEWVNDAFERMSGYRRSEAVGRTPSLLRASVQPVDVFGDMWRAAKRGETWRGEIVNKRKDGSLYIVSQTVTPMFDEQRVMTHLVAAHEDITARREAEARVSHLAEHDALTDLPNRTMLHRSLVRALEKPHEPVAVLFLDLDRFKLVNDTLGHGAGDDLLRAVAERIRRCVRDNDVVARQGGDEFIVLLPSAGTPTAAQQVAVRILNRLAEPVKVAERLVHVTASIGIALSPLHENDADALIRRADTAMYRAKQTGRNNVVCYSPDLDSGKADLSVQSGLARALSNGELSLAYQPQLELATKSVTGVEALLRWTSPELGAVSPADFIPVAEETGLIADIDRWVVRAVCAQAKAWRDAGIFVPRIALNLSGTSFRHGALSHLESAIAHHDIPPEQIEIELTEGAVMQDVQNAIETLDAFRGMGVRVALDDFGTGYSSLVYLKRFKIDTLKIDRSFVTGLPNRTDDAAIAKLIVSMARTLGMATVAEGVETAEQAQFLQSIGCSAAQGFLYARALAPDALERFLAANTMIRVA
jgi:diguanylate cyclase (GGDEF)-like protein/PAS domain S-box-containing protein